MSIYKVKTAKELYPVKDIIFAVTGIACAIVAGIFVANFVTSFAGI